PPPPPPPDPAGKFAHVAPKEVLLDEGVAPAGPGDGVPAEAQHNERYDPRGCAEPDEPAQGPLPEQEQGQRRREGRRPHGSLRERREPEEHEGRRCVALPPFAT